jgi:hypothetical protein
MPAVRHASHMTLEPWSAQSASETKAKRSELGAQLLTLMLPCPPNNGIRHRGLVQSLARIGCFATSKQ